LGGEQALVIQAASQRSEIDMAEHIKKEEFVRRLAKKMGTDEATAEAWLDATLEAMYQVFKTGKGISLAGFGGFYLDRRRESTAFKFNPGQKLRALFGWSSKYKGKL
jgi:nucleoid DNA-binding protein